MPVPVSIVNMQQVQGNSAHFSTLDFHSSELAQMVAGGEILAVWTVYELPTLFTLFFAFIFLYLKNILLDHFFLLY